METHELYLGLMFEFYQDMVWPLSKAERKSRLLAISAILTAYELNRGSCPYRDLDYLDKRTKITKALEDNELYSE